MVQSSENTECSSLNGTSILNFQSPGILVEVGVGRMQKPEAVDEYKEGMFSGHSRVIELTVVVIACPRLV